MKKGKCFLSILVITLFILSMLLMCFAQADIGAAENDGREIETVLEQREREENTAAYDKIYAALLEHEESIDLLL